MDDARVVTIVREELRRCASIAAKTYGYVTFPVRLEWNLFGTAAGQAVGHKVIRINIELMRHQSEREIAQVAAHELAHVVVHKEYYHSVFIPWLRDLNEHSFDWSSFDESIIPPRPSNHGPEWTRMMELFGHEPNIYHNFCVKNVRNRPREFAVHCRCHTYKIGERRLIRLLTGKTAYFCSRCREKVRT